MRKGFTLIELLVVISIIGLLAAAGLTVFSSAQRRARDAKRISDIKAIETALQGHYSEFGSYTHVENLCTDTSIGAYGNCGGSANAGDWDPNSDLRDLVPDYMVELPLDPINNTTYRYTYEPSHYPGVAGPQTYYLCATLEEGGTFCSDVKN